MTSWAFTSYLTCLFLWRIVLTNDLQVSLHMSQKKVFISENAGGSVTLPCFFNNSAASMFLWYKQTLGQSLNLVVKLYRYNTEGEFTDEFQNNPRYSLDGSKDGKFHLTISDLQFSDSATYFCMGSSAHRVGFGEGTTLRVKGSGRDIKVHQSASETFHPEDDVPVSCTLHAGNRNGRQRVYWYESSEDPNPGLFYVNESEDDQREAKPKAQTCVYHQATENRAHNWTDVCAVASCGRLLFGDGPKLKDEASSPSLLVCVLSGALACNLALCLFLAFFVYKLKKRDAGRCTAGSQTTLGPATTNAEDADHLHYAALRKQTVKRPRRQTDDTVTECVYSSVKL
ncbi:unnamed protein product [Ophioblennius macclurei]